MDKRILGQYINLEALSKKEENFKSRLLEWSQKNKLRAEFKLENTEGENSNSPVFNTVILLEGKKAGKGRGYSKKESQQNAARQALETLNKDTKFKDSIFAAKESRTAMEAQEFAALPPTEVSPLLPDKTAKK